MTLTPAPAVDSHSEDERHRAVHRIRLSALEHNYSYVESAANQQRCSVISVVKADGYGHGAIATALHLADRCGADAFAVATLEEAIHLRRAFESNPPGRWSKQLASHFHVAHDSTHPAYWAASSAVANATSHTATSQQTAPLGHTNEAEKHCMRPARIRILVLGPPVGFPRSFDDYYYHGIELMVSGPEVAKHLLDWIKNDKLRKQTEVERAANEAKAKALIQPFQPRDATRPPPPPPPTLEEKAVPAVVNMDTNLDQIPAEATNKKALPHPSSTLGNVSGQDLAKEVRAMLMNQKAATEANNLEEEAERLQKMQMRGSNVTSAAQSVATSSAFSVASSTSGESSSHGSDLATHKSVAPTVASSTTTTTSSFAAATFLGSNSNSNPTTNPASGNKNAGNVFCGLEAMAKSSRAHEQAVQRYTPNGTPTQTTAPAPVQAASRKRLRWHALIDSGMGRAGFKTHSPEPGENRQDTVDILQELVDAEIHGNAPIEFFGMCTHMADANSTSTYTNDQIQRFQALLNRVRERGISVPTISTDNSAALLTTTLTHFDADQLLSQPGVDSRGFVRVGGAIYCQRPAFRELRAVSTLVASVRHVAVLQQGESVGYDRAYVAPYAVRIATLTIGFADGYPRTLGNGVGKVQIRGKVFPVAGNVCMDMLMVELGPANASDPAHDAVGASVSVGDTAVLWGPLEEEDGEGLVRLQDLAATLKTTQSSLTCGLDKLRVRRSFL